MVTVRQASTLDLLEMHQCNHEVLDEYAAYSIKYYLWHFLTYPELQFVAVSEGGKVVGYILSKLEDVSEEFKGRGHITSIGVK